MAAAGTSYRRQIQPLLHHRIVYDIIISRICMLLMLGWLSVVDDVQRRCCRRRNDEEPRLDCLVSVPISRYPLALLPDRMMRSSLVVDR